MEQLGFGVTDKRLLVIAKALGNKSRLAMLDLLGKKAMGIKDLAEALRLTQPAVSQHVEILRKAGLVKLELYKKERYSFKHVHLCYDKIQIDLSGARQSDDCKFIRCETPIGSFVDASIQPPCGMCDAAGIIKVRDHEQVFSHPDRWKAQKLWIASGYLEYRFPREFPKGSEVEELIFSAEISSEASLPVGHTECPSDITLWINGVEIGTWTCPGFFTGTRGRYTPDWVNITENQYGLLKTWRINSGGSRIDGLRLSDVVPGDLNLFRDKFIRVRIGHKPDAANKNGINLFGQKFGNYPQDLVLQVKYLNVKK